MPVEVVSKRGEGAIVLHSGHDHAQEALAAAYRYKEESPDAYGYDDRGIFAAEDCKLIVWRDRRGLNVRVET